MSIYLIIALLGFLAGMFVNYLADVLPVKRQLSAPFCRVCGEKQSLVNYLFWPRRCNACSSRRTMRTWIVELAFVVATLWLFILPPAKPGFLLGWVLLIYFGLVAVIDLEHRLILNSVSLVGAALGLVVGIWAHGIYSTLLGGITGFAVMLVLYLLGGVLMGWLARRRGKELHEEALGFGDVNLGGVLGLVLGWPGIVIGLMLTVLLAGLVSLIYLLYSLLTRRYRHDMAIPYGPFLISSAIALLFFRNIVLTYLGW
jgi:leader peptidase (prepilin peptidase)/N-methyltransferase